MVKSNALTFIAIIAGLASILPGVMNVPQPYTGKNLQVLLLKSRIRRAETVHACGKNLHMALDLVCEGKFNSPGRKRADLLINAKEENDQGFLLEQRSQWNTGGPLIRDTRSTNSKEDADQEYSPYFLDTKTAYSLLGSPQKPAKNNGFLLFRAARGGVVEECCLKACTTTELKGYCSS